MEFRAVGGVCEFRRPREISVSQDLEVESNQDEPNSNAN